LNNPVKTQDKGGANYATKPGQQHVLKAFVVASAGAGFAR